LGYMHIENLYKSQKVLLFKQVYATEKIHGTSAHINFIDGQLTFFSGGEKHEKFLKFFNVEELTKKFQSVFGDLGAKHDWHGRKVTVYGEAYGGSCMGMSETYGKELKFIVFDVYFESPEGGGHWLSVPDAADVAAKLGLEFVHYELVEADLAVLNRLRDADSVQAVRNGCGPGHQREGIVIRPPTEVVMNNGGRLMAKHKAESFTERVTQPKVIDAAKLEVLQKAEAIAQEWVTEMRLTHVADKLAAELQRPLEMKDTGAVIKAMIEDVNREAAGEIVTGKDADRAIGTRTALMFKRRVMTIPESRS
jgi:RNA ligase